MIAAAQMPEPVRRPFMRLDRHDRVTVRGMAFCLPERNDGGYVLHPEGAVSLAQAFTDEDLEKAKAEPGWDYEPGFFDPDRARARLSSGADSMADLAAKEHWPVLVRFEFVTRFLRMEANGEANRSDDGVEHALAQIEPFVQQLEEQRRAYEALAKPGRKRKPGRKPTKPRKARVLKAKGADELRPSGRQFRRWLQRFEENGCVPWSLRDNYRLCGCRGPAIVGHALLLLAQYGDRYADPVKPTYAQLHRGLKDEVRVHNETCSPADKVALPSIKALKGYIRGLSRFFVFSRRHGVEAAKRRFRTVGSGPDVVRPGDRIEIDHWEVDLQSVLMRMDIWHRLSGDVQRRIGRAYLCVAIDCATKVILGAWISETPRASDVMQVLRMTLVDKTPLAQNAGAETPWDMATAGVVYATDTGGALIATEVRTAIANLRRHHLFPPPGVPQLRGTIERFFRTIHIMLISGFHGRTFGSPGALGDYPAEKLAHMSTEDLSWAFVRFFVDVYHNSPHDGLWGETPRDAWLRLTAAFGTRPAPGPNALRAIFGTPISRQLGNEGIRVLGLSYWSEAVSRHFLDNGEVELDVRMDPMNLGAVSVLLPQGWVPAICQTEGYDGLSMEAWLRTLVDLRRTFGEAAELAAPVVRAARDAIRDRHDQSLARAGISVVVPGPEDVRRAEQEIVAGLRIPPTPRAVDAADPVSDLLAGGIPVTGPVGAPVVAELPRPQPEPKRTRASRKPPAASDPEDDDFEFER